MLLSASCLRLARTPSEHARSPCQSEETHTCIRAPRQQTLSAAELRTGVYVPPVRGRAGPSQVCLHPPDQTIKPKIRPPPPRLRSRRSPILAALPLTSSAWSE